MSHILCSDSPVSWLVALQILMGYHRQGIWAKVKEEEGFHDNHVDCMVNTSCFCDCRSDADDIVRFSEAPPPPPPPLPPRPTSGGILRHMRVKISYSILLREGGERLGGGGGGGHFPSLHPLGFSCSLRLIIRPFTKLVLYAINYIGLVPRPPHSFFRGEPGNEATTT